MIIAATNGLSADGGNAVQLLILVGAVTLVPALLFCVTGFTRILVVLGFIRTGLGTPTAPPNQVLVGIALFLTIFVMAPTFTKVKTDAIDPLSKNEITQAQALDRGQKPLREFMFRQTRTKDLALFVGLSKLKRPQTRADVPTYVLIPAFIISELKTAFQIGFLIFLPFLVIDLVVSSTLMSTPLQDPAVRPRGRLGLGHPLARGVVSLMNQDVVISLATQAMSLALKISLPLLGVGLIVGVLISIIQAVTSIQEQTLAFIPKVVAMAVVLVIGGPWMLNQLLSYTSELWTSIPNMVG
jgi:flagellar biosynthetic protein FliP